MNLLFSFFVLANTEHIRFLIFQEQYICLYKCLYECFRAEMCVVTKDELQKEPILLRANNEFCVSLLVLYFSERDVTL